MPRVWARHSCHARCGLATSRASSLRCLAPPDVGTALPEANSFLRIRQPFGDIACEQVGGNADAVTAVTDETASAPSVVGLTFRNLVSTLEQSPVRGGTAAIRSSIRSPRRLASETRSLPTAIASRPVCRTWLPDATRSDSRGQGQADLSTQQPAPCAGAWVPATDADQGGPGDRGQPAR